MKIYWDDPDVYANIVLMTSYYFKVYCVWAKCVCFQLIVYISWIHSCWSTAFLLLLALFIQWSIKTLTIGLGAEGTQRSPSLHHCPRMVGEGSAASPDPLKALSTILAQVARVQMVLDFTHWPPWQWALGTLGCGITA